MSYPAYSEYRYTGVEWLENVPAHWSVSKVKYIAKYINGLAFKPEEWGEVGRKIVRIQNLTNPETEYNYYDGEKDERCLIQRGDILISWSASLGVHIWQGEEAWLNQHIFKVHVNNRLVRNDFFLWLSKWFVSELEKEAHGSTMKHITFPKFGAFELLLPPQPEQQAIAVFLNRETARIDGLIGKKERLIKLLEEKRQAVISHAVTKGLNSNAPLKDSGIDWVGQIPEHWAVKRGRHIYKQLDLPPLDEDGVVTAFRDGQVTLRANRRTEGFTFAIKEVGYQHVRTGDLVIHSMDAFAGAIGVSESDGKCTGEYVVCDPINSNSNNHYFASVLRWMAKQNYIFVICPSVRERAPRFRYVRFAEALLPVPPIDEQNEIIAYIESEVTKIDALKSRAQQAIDRLKEHRTSLISAAVTGKIDVRGLVDEGEAA